MFAYLKWILGASLLSASMAGRAEVHAPWTPANVPVELTFRSSIAHRDPFNQVDLDVVFKDSRGHIFRVPAFWDGGSVWKVRYASPLVGKHAFYTVCGDPADIGLSTAHGTVEITRYTGKNPLFVHGPLKVDSGKRHLDYGDGKPFFWLADTWWMGLAQRLRWPDEFKALASDRVAKGFNVVQIVAGLYPDSFPFDPRGANEAGFPWRQDYSAINPAYFDRADQRIRYLVDQGISPCIVGAWGYYMKWMGPERLARHWRYLIARYGAMPVVWCAAGEANLPWYLDQGFPFEFGNQVHDWTSVVRYIKKTDPFHRVLTIHPTAAKTYTSRDAVDDPSLLDFDMLQTPHAQHSGAAVTRKQAVASYNAKPTMPVIDGEAAYEMLMDSLPTRWTRAMFWLMMTNGAAGHTYGANGIWQNNRPGDPHGKSPHGGMYGVISSQKAMHLPGSAQEGYGKRLFERYPWWNFKPHPEWALSGSQFVASLSDSDWIWTREGKPSEDAPVGFRYFRQRLYLLPDFKSATLCFSADDAAEAFVNGVKVGACLDWRHPVKVDIPIRLLKGHPVLAFKAENKAAAVTKNPAGLIATLTIRTNDDHALQFMTNDRWACSNEAPDGWDQEDFDDSHWEKAQDLGAYGCPPWGDIDVEVSSLGPQSTGLAHGVRLIYSLMPLPVSVHNLESGRTYKAERFDPVTGQSMPLDPIRGEATVSPPVGYDHDWVLILTPTTK